MHGVRQQNSLLLQPSLIPYIKKERYVFLMSPSLCNVVCLPLALSETGFRQNEWCTVMQFEALATRRCNKCWPTTMWATPT